jgi:hypothetical protein
MAEFGFRWNTRKNSDGERVQKAIMAAEGKRLMYREPLAVWPTHQTEKATWLLD